MITKKYWFLGGIVLTCLCIAVLLAGTQLSKGIQWEYARYQTTIFPGFPGASISTRSWGTPTEYFFTTSGTASELWKKAGFNFGDKDVVVVDWFNFLGKQGWELICMEVDKTDAEENTTYWFKRHK